MDLSAEAESRRSEDSVTYYNTKTEEKDAETGGRDDHRFQKAISAWRGIDLVNLVPQLDKTAAEVVDNQKDAFVQRKELAQKTKDFRRLDDDAKLQEWKTLLKAYQSFVDLLTNHGKTTSSAFLQLYSSLSDVPDPYPLLEASVDSLLLSEDVLPKLNSENDELKRTVRKLTRDLENAEKRLEQERTERKKLDDAQDARAKEIEASWEAVMGEKKENWEAKERALEEKVENQDRLLKEIKASYEVSQRLGLQQGDDQDSRQNAASAAELEIVNSELERTSQRLADMEARNEQLRVELAQMSSNAPKRQDPEDDPVVSRLRTENGSLLRRLDAVKLEKDSNLRKVEGRVKALERESKSLQQEKEALKQKVNAWRDYPELKRELEVFKAIELSTEDGEEGGLALGDENARHRRSTSITNGTAGSKKESLEQLLLARNKKLSSEMATLRVAHHELRQELDNLRESVSATNAELERTQNLNATLENDLLTLQQEASNQFPSSAKSTTSRYPVLAGYPSSQFPSRTRRSSPTSSIISGFDPQRSPFDPSDSLRTPETPYGGGSGILPMVQAQRDRFRQKNSQLEQELTKQYNFVSSLRQEVASLQKDNLNLYEKTRYVSTYNRGAAHQSSSASAYSQNPGSAVIQMDADPSSGPAMDRYRSAYEANISPFAAFRGREASRALKRMTMPERMVFSITKFVLQSRTSRNLFAVYCVALHLLVFVMLYWMHGVDTSRHASHLSEATAAAVGEMGGGAAGPLVTDAHHGDWHQEDLSGALPAT